MSQHYSQPEREDDAHALPNVETFQMAFTLRRIRINQSGYDSFGNYWGIGAPLYEAEAEDAPAAYGDTYVVRYLRATDRDHAKAQLVASYPHATFKR